MQKNIIYLLLLIIVGSGVYFLVFEKNDANIFGEDEASFKVQDTASIGKIYMVRSNGESINVERTDEGWVVNGKYKAHRGTLKALLRTLHQQEAQFPAPEKAHNSVVKSMAGNSVKVEIYNRAGKNIRTFYVGKESYNYSGTYMLMEGAEKPYLVKVPGHEGILEPYFVTELPDWRDRNVFNLLPEEISKVHVDYPHTPEQSFTMMQNGALSVQAAPQVIGGNELNTKRAEAYLSFFHNVNCEGYLNGTYKLDSIIASVTKKCLIEVTNKAGQQQRVEIYNMPLTRRSKNMNEEDAMYDADRYYAVMNDYKDTAIVQSRTFDKLFRAAVEFYTPEKPVTVMGLEGATQ